MNKKVKFNDNWVCGSKKFGMYEEHELTAEEFELGKDLKTSFDINKPLFTVINDKSKVQG
jgi:hypothetical protein